MGLPELDSAEKEQEDDKAKDLQPAAQMHVKWTNEKYAPELLPFESRLVTDLHELLDFVADDLRSEDALKQAAEDEGEMADHMRCKRIELDRIRYIVRDYLRIRIWKLTQYPQHYLEGGNEELLSDAERRFLRDYWHNKKQFLDNRFLSVLPPVKAKLEDHMLRRPNLESNVMVQVNDEIDPIMMPPRTQSQGESPGSQEPLNLKPGGTYLLKYKLVRDYFMHEALQGKVELV